MIRTQYEIDGRWSSSEFGQQFMVNLSTETNTPLFSIGQSHLGKELYGMEFGKGSRTLLITGGVHRSEQASRELVMMKCRDFAYNVSGEYNDYLLNHKIIFIPTVSPDVTTRNNAQGLNINRDAFDLDTPEMQALMNFVTDVEPEIYIDFHERGGTPIERVEFINPSELDPNADPKVREYSQKMETFTRDNLESEGYVTVPYPRSGIGPGKTVSASALFGSVTMTPETHIHIENVPYRVEALNEVFDNIITWHKTNHNALDEIKKSYNNGSLNEGDNFVLLNGSNEYYVNSEKVNIITPKGYKLEDVSLFEKWEKTYNIEVDKNGFVPINQRAGRILPYLLDPQSDLKAVKAVRVESKEPERRTDGRYTKVLMDGWQEVFIKYM